MREAEIEHKILIYLFERGDGFFWKNVSNGYHDGKSFRKQASPFAFNGSPDILGCIRGRLVGFEVKADNGRQSEAQKIFERRIKKSGGRYAVVRSIADVERCLDEWGISSRDPRS